MSVLRTQIRVKCNEVAVNALGVEWATLDLTPEFTLRLSKDVETLTDVNELLTEGVLPFSVPFSTTNDLVLARYGSPIIFNPTNDGIEARVHCDGHELPFDMIFFREKDNNRKSWEMEFRRSPNHWLELASEKKLCTIEAGSFTLNEANVTAGWAQPKFDAAGAVTDLVRWWPVDYGGWVDLAEPIQFTDPAVKGVWVEDLRPFFSVPELLRLGFCDIGWTLEGLIFETPWATALWDYILKRDYYTESRGGTAMLLLSNNEAAPWQQGISGIGDFLVCTVVEYDPGTNAEAIISAPGYYWSGFTNPLPFKARFSFCFSGDINNPSPTFGADVFLSVWEADFPNSVATFVQIAPYQPIGRLEATETKGFSVCIDADLEVGQSAFLVMSGVFDAVTDVQSAALVTQKGFKVTVKPNMQCLVRGDVVDLKKLIDCDYYLLDRFKGFLHLINGRVKTDWNTKTIYVYPERTADVYGDSTPGFIDESEVIDLTGKVVCDSVRQSPVKNELKRYTRLEFAESTDALITDIDPIEPYWSRKILNGLDLPDQIEERENPFWEPTIERKDDRLRLSVDLVNTPFPTVIAVYVLPYLPVMVDNLDGNRSFNIRPRILFAFGVVGQVETSTLASAQTALYFENAVFSEFGYATQARTLDLNPSFPPHLDGAVVFGTLPSDLYVTFYLGLSQINTRGRWVDMLVLMGMNDWAAWDFRKQFSFTYEGRPVIAVGQNIRDFAPTTNLPTPMRLLANPNVSECCDGPCSCRYTECEYWQDFGQYMSQQTLDTLSITSFTVNGIEQLDAPVDFGIINVVSINGKAFVTNLVDALNGLEIPYFSFRPGESDYPEKDDLRYFKIKRPSCQTFRIEISVEAAVYFYSDTAMGSKWFSGGDYEPFGYVGNPIDEPQNCVETVEY